MEKQHYSEYTFKVTGYVKVKVPTSNSPIDDCRDAWSLFDDMKSKKLKCLDIDEEECLECEDF